jgi:hypothetical protein
MLVRLHTSVALRATAGLALALTVGGCGKSASSSSGAHSSAVAEAPSTPASCAETVLKTLRRVAMHIYEQGLSGERPRTAARIISASAGLREAVEHGDATATRAAAKALVAGGHVTSLRVLSGGRALADVGSPSVTPLHGTLTGASGQPIASYVTSVWSDEGLLAETSGVTHSRIAIRAHGRSIGGSFALRPGALAAKGTMKLGGERYQYTSFRAEAFPSGALRIYLLKPVSATTGLCGKTGEDTIVNTLSRIAHIIYAGEAGRRARMQVQRVQHDQPLLRAAAARDPVATKAAIETLLTDHVVRLRVSVGGKLLSDVGGPYVLAPVAGQLRMPGRTIGSFLLSIQDDEGYLRLTKRLVGVRVLMYMDRAHPQLVKNSLGPSPGKVPASGSYEYRGHRFRVFTLNATAFPDGPLTIRVLVPMPYS